MGFFLISATSVEETASVNCRDSETLAAHHLNLLKIKELDRNQGLAVSYFHELTGPNRMELFLASEDGTGRAVARQETLKSRPDAAHGPVPFQGLRAPHGPWRSAPP